MSQFADFRDDIHQCIEVLKNGGIILYPTDTIWGIGCDATNQAAVEKIYKLKKRTDSKTMLVLLENENLLRSYIKEIPDIAWDLIEVSNRPITIIYPGAKNLAKNLIAGDGSIGIRITREAFSSELIRNFRKPIVSTSANISGELSPGSFNEISATIVDSVDYVVKYRQDELSRSAVSEIIKIGIGGEIEILRKVK
ncbi:MAG: threonylcarbamoyl-AMP synthase [Bacteroidales bacterium]|nr:threonylcarbamoyl-AMP synthase [Bacteroidales bacterium]MCF8389128.1 threonylcarbamoyl-AMP synthase [Bacteroidales bacterium]